MYAIIVNTALLLGLPLYSHITQDVITHWLDLMNHEGWIPREQILGAEARNKVPSVCQFYMYAVNNVTSVLSFS